MQRTTIELLQNKSRKERFLIRKNDCSPCLGQEAIDRMPAACPLQIATLDLMRLTGASSPEAHFDARPMARLSA